MDNRGQRSRRSIGDATTQPQISKQFSTPTMKNHVSVDDPTRALRKEGEHDETKKKTQRNETKHLLRLQGTDG